MYISDTYGFNQTTNTHEVVPLKRHDFVMEVWGRSSCHDSKQSCEHDHVCEYEDACEHECE